MTTNPMYPHLRHAHRSESATALLALGYARAFTRCQPPPNQLTLQKDPLPIRPLPGVFGWAFSIPAIGCLFTSSSVHPRTLEQSPRGSKTRIFRGSYGTEQSDFSGKNHSSAFAAQRTGSCACRARSGIHMAISQFSP